MWSLGVILYELCTLQKPFQATSVEQLREKVLKEKPLVPQIKSIAKEQLEIVAKLLKKNPIYRLSV